MSTDKLNRLKAVLDTYGANPARWPAADQSELAGLLNQQAGLQSEVRDAGEVDRIVAAASAPVAPRDAGARLLDLARETSQTGTADDKPGLVHDFGIGRFAAASTLAGSLILGVYMGTLDSLDPLVPDEDEVSILENPFWFENLEDDGGEGSG